MFLEFYGLDEQPFGVTPDPKYFFGTKRHCEALATLICGIEEFTGFAALFSEPGLGKTTLLFQILERYQDHSHTAFVFNTQCDREGLLRQIAEDLQLEVENDVLTFHSALRTLISTSPYKLPVIIIIDEGQDLEEGALEALRLLSDIEAPNRKLIHFILAGQPELAAKLAAPGLRQLLNRITTLSRLEPLGHSDVSNYISHRMSVAGYAGPPLFTKEAVDAIAMESKGVPRQVNRICFNSLSLGFALQQTRIGADIVAEVIQDLDIRLALPKDAGRLDTLPAETGLNIPPPGCRQLARPTDPLGHGFAAKPDVDRNSQLTPYAEEAFTPSPHRLAGSNWAGSVQKASLSPPESSRSSPAGWHGTERLMIVVVVVATLATLGRYAQVSNIFSQPSGPRRIVSEPIVSSAGSAPKSLKPADSLASAHAAIGASAPVRAGEKSRSSSAKTAISPEAGSIAIAISPPVLAKRESGEDAAGPHMSEDSPHSVLASDLDDAAVPDRRTDSAHIKEGRLIKAVRPVYPAIAAKSRIEGDVLLAIVVNEKGTVEAVSAVRGVKPLADSALEAVKRWRFEPYSLNGEPRRVSVNVTVHFRVTSS